MLQRYELFFISANISMIFFQEFLSLTFINNKNKKSKNRNFLIKIILKYNLFSVYTRAYIILYNAKPMPIALPKCKTLA